MKDKLVSCTRKKTCVVKVTFTYSLRIIYTSFSFQNSIERRTVLHCAAVMAGMAATWTLVVFLITAVTALPSTLLEDTIQAAESEPITSKGKKQVMQTSSSQSEDRCLLG
jgi:hypothetical protein